MGDLCLSSTRLLYNSVETEVNLEKTVRNAVPVHRNANCVWWNVVDYHPVNTVHFCQFYINL